ncbi:ATPase family AAA domain-containing protein 2 isoform X1 [Lepisosteus oculatus]|uniref:ATPase family AAA domain-containing protein 2 isoform X1 n=1 Tax=Lepisosteus oculatus TaxID=7918 RepID=UPI0035F51259
MVMLRSSAGADPASPKKLPALDSSAEFLSLTSARRRSARSRRAADDSSSGAENTPTRHSHVSVKDEENVAELSLRKTNGQKEKQEVSFSDFKDKETPQKDGKERKHFTRKSARLQADEKSVEDHPKDDSDASPTSRTPESRAAGMEVESEVRRSSRISRYRLNARNQSVLYDRLITNTAEAVLQKMDDMQKMRRRLRSRDTQQATLGIYSGAKRKRESERTDEETDNQEDGNEGFTEEEEEEDEDEDGEEDNQKRYEFRQRKTVVRYQAPLDEPRKQSLFYNSRSSSDRRRYRFSSNAPRSPYSKRRNNRIGSADRRRHAIHSSDSTSSSSPSSDDEQHFERRRNKSRNRSVNRCLPLNFRKEDLLGIHQDRMKIGTSLADVDPMQIDTSVRFDSIGGLSSHIASLKEMVVFPLLYPEVFERFKIQPPRGCLFYGPPGTGKTLVARVLANECSQGDRKVAFFMRKGADCLSKWVGESERQLRLLFDQAYQMRPSIIFFDEIDGLAPVRSSRQDQIHSSIVSTLLALMDGLDSRGEVVVIGATNRLDSIDPALRRPGRFDREFLFGLPDREARKEILKIHTRPWSPQPSDIFLEELADKCVGYCGADIKAVCTEAALCALRRRYPQIYSTSEKLQLDVASITITSKDFMLAMRKTVPASQRAVSSPGKALSPIVQPLLSSALESILEALHKVFPHAEQGLKRKRDTDITANILDDDLMYSDDEGQSVCQNGPLQRQAHQNKPFLHSNRSAHYHPTSYRPRLLLAGRPGSGQSSHLAPAVLHALEKFTVYTLDMAVLYGISSASPEETCAQLFCEAKRTSPSILYIPNIDQWWETVGSALRATFLSLLHGIPSFSPILLLATCSVSRDCLYKEVQDLFQIEYGEVFCVQLPSQQERRKLFEDLILNQTAKPPASKKKAVMRALEVLPVAPPAPPRQLSEAELQRLEEQEEDTLRELRLFLRDVTNRLAMDKRFRAFTKPVDIEEVPDYKTVIRQPMDLSTVLCKIDLHKYVTVKDYMEDVDLIWKNALEYNPDKDPADRLIRHRACALKDTVHAIIREELDENFEKLCEDIQESRKKRGFSTSQFAPSYYHVLPKQTNSTDSKKNESNVAKDSVQTSAAPVTTSTPRPQAVLKRKRRRCRWSNGFIAKKKTSSATSKEGVNGLGLEGEEKAEEVAESEDCDELDALLSNGSSLEPIELERCEDSAGEGDLEAPENIKAKHPITDEPAQLEHQAEKLPSTPAESDGTDNQEEPREKNALRMTRGRRSQVEQQQLINVEKAMKILSEVTPQLVVDHQKLKNLLDRVIAKTEGFEVYQLEKLYALLCQCIYRHRRNYDKTALIQEMKKEIENFT